MPSEQLARRVRGAAVEPLDGEVGRGERAIAEIGPRRHLERLEALRLSPLADLRRGSVAGGRQ